MKTFLQFRLRSLFILTAVVALSLGLWVRSRHLAAMARFHTQQQRIMEDRCLNLVLEDKNAQPELREPSDESRPGREMPPAKLAEANQYYALAKYHDEVSLRYQIGSYLPFLPVSIPELPDTDAQLRQTRARHRCLARVLRRAADGTGVPSYCAKSHGLLDTRFIAALRLSSGIAKTGEFRGHVKRSSPAACDAMMQYLPEVAELVQEHDRFIRWATFKYRRYFRMQRDDAIQSAALGMLYAARNFRSHQGCSFATYALKRMLVTGRRESLRVELPMRVPIRDYWRCIWLDNRVRLCGRKSLHKRFVKSKQLRRQIVFCLKTIWRIRRTKSLSIPGSKLVKSIVAPTFNLEAKLEREEQAALVRDALDRLEPLDGELLRRRYGIGCRAQTLEELGQRYNLTRERVRQRQVRAEQRLRSILTGEPIARHEHSRKKWLEQLSQKPVSRPGNDLFIGDLELVSS